MSTATAAAPAPLPDELTTAGFASLFAETLRKQIRIWPSRSWAPSQVGHPCDRYLVWRWTRAQDQLPHDPMLEAVFQEGNLHQPHVYARLEQMGFEVVRESDRPERWQPKPGIILSGRIDGRVTGFKGRRYPRPLVLEIKTIAPHAFDQLDTLQDLVEHRAYYVRGYYVQMQLYLLLDNTDMGLIVLKSKGSGALRALPVPLDLVVAEAALKRIERLHPFVKDEKDPPPIPYDAAVCGRCGFLPYCWPPREEEGMEVVDDGDLVDLLIEHERLKRLKYGFEDLDQQIKDRMKPILTKDGQRALIRGGAIGDYLASLKIVTMPERTLKAGAQRRVSFERLGDAPAAEE